MKRKGFTLVELVAIIALLAIISALIFPQIKSNITNKNQLQYNKLLILIKNSAKSYHSSHSDATKIFLSTLIEEEYLSNDLINPLTNQAFTGCVAVSLDLNGYYQYAYVDSNTTCHAGEIYTITYELNDGTVSGTNPDSYTVESESITLINPTKNSDTFIGWTGSNGTVPELTVTIPSGSIGNKNYIANWQTNLVTLTLDLDGGSISPDPSGEYSPNEPVTIPIPTRTGYAFAGWTGGTVTDNEITIGDSDITLTATWIAYADMFTYTVNGNPGVSGTDYELIDDLNGNWRIKFLTSGTLSVFINTDVEAFLVGGGGSGGTGSNGYAGSGGGGYTTTVCYIQLLSSETYNIVVAAGGAGRSSQGISGSTGGTTTAFGYFATGGGGGGYTGNPGVSGGSGGSAGGNVYNLGATDGGYIGTTKGQRRTTREFAESTGDLYASGGGGYTIGINTGNGSGGGQFSSEAGSTGIVIIRNIRRDISKFHYTGVYEYIDDGGGDWRIKFLTSGILIPLEDIEIDAFLVGGGGSGGAANYGYAGGGGSGYTNTNTNEKIQLKAEREYQIVIGEGASQVGMGSSGNAGEETTAFGYSADGGGGGGTSSNPSVNGGSGGSGGSNVYVAGGVDGAAGGGSTGQGTTTREFGELTGQLYSSGGGADSGGHIPNSGNGGSSGVNSSEPGSSGIVVIRNTRH